jgi:hypothetical protein
MSSSVKPTTQQSTYLLLPVAQEALSPLTSPAVETEMPLLSFAFSPLMTKPNAAINLSASASGTGGFVINGDNAEDWSGISVSTAGDVNGDGLDDIACGGD